MRMLASDAMVCYKPARIFIRLLAAYYSVLLILVPSSCTTGTITLMDGRSGMEGRVEMCRGGVWGAVYDYGGWDFNDAQITCKQLGYPSNCKLANSAHCHVIWTQKKVYILSLMSEVHFTQS